MREAQRGVERLCGRRAKTLGIAESAGTMVDVREVDKTP